MACTGQTSAASSSASRRSSPPSSCSCTSSPSSSSSKTCGAEKTHCPWCRQTSRSTLTLIKPRSLLLDEAGVQVLGRGPDAAELPVAAERGGDDLLAGA